MGVGGGVPHACGRVFEGLGFQEWLSLPTWWGSAWGSLCKGRDQGRGVLVVRTCHEGWGFGLRSVIMSRIQPSSFMDVHSKNF